MILRMAWVLKFFMVVYARVRVMEVYQQGYLGYVSQVLIIILTGTDNHPQGY